MPKKNSLNPQRARFNNLRKVSARALVLQSAPRRPRARAPSQNRLAQSQRDKALAQLASSLYGKQNSQVRLRTVRPPRINKPKMLQMLQSRTIPRQLLSAIETMVRHNLYRISEILLAGLNGCTGSMCPVLQSSITGQIGGTRISRSTYTVGAGQYYLFVINPKTIGGGYYTGGTIGVPCGTNPVVNGNLNSQANFNWQTPDTSLPVVSAAYFTYNPTNFYTTSVCGAGGTGSVSPVNVWTTLAYTETPFPIQSGTNSNMPSAYSVATATSTTPEQWELQGQNTYLIFNSGAGANGLPGVSSTVQSRGGNTTIQTAVPYQSQLNLITADLTSNRRAFSLESPITLANDGSTTDSNAFRTHPILSNLDGYTYNANLAQVSSSYTIGPSPELKVAPYCSDLAMFISNTFAPVYAMGGSSTAVTHLAVHNPPIDGATVFKLGSSDSINQAAGVTLNPQDTNILIDTHIADWVAFPSVNNSASISLSSNFNVFCHNIEAERDGDGNSPGRSSFEVSASPQVAVFGVREFFAGATSMILVQNPSSTAASFTLTDTHDFAMAVNPVSALTTLAQPVQKYPDQQYPVLFGASGSGRTKQDAMCDMMQRSFQNAQNSGIPIPRALQETVMRRAASNSGDINTNGGYKNIAFGEFLSQVFSSETMVPLKQALLTLGGSVIGGVATAAGIAARRPWTQNRRDMIEP